MPNGSKALEYLAKLQGNRMSPTRQREEAMHKEALKGNALLPGSRTQIIDGSDLLSPNDSVLMNFRKFGDCVPPGDSVFDYATMRRQKEVFDCVIRDSFRDKNRYDTSATTDYGTLESPILNAMISPVPGCNEFLIIFNRGLWQAISAFSCLVASSLELSQPIYSLKPEKAIEHSDAFAVLLQRILLQQDLPLSNPADPRGTIQNWFWNVLHDGMQGFVFAHEYAHLLHGHLDNRAIHYADGIAEEQIAYYQPLWAQEYEADRTGLDLNVFAFILMEENRKDFPAQSTLEKGFSHNEAIVESLYGTLAFLHFLCRIERMMDFVYSPTSSHPPTWFRIQRIMGILPHQFQDHKTLDFIVKRIHGVTEGVSYFFDNIAKPIKLGKKDPLLFYERRLQDIVFFSLFHRRYFDVLVDLYQDRKSLSDTPQEHNVVDAMSDKFSHHLHMWAHWLKYGTCDITVSDTAQMIDRCIGILERNADIWRFNRPKSTL